MTAPEEPGDRRERIAKVIARAGLCSRREAEEWIAAGRVAVNGTTLDTPAHTVAPEDHVVVDGTPLPTREPTRLWLYHKPRGLMTTNFDPEGRPTVFDHLPAELPRVVTVGRLDINTEGLLLLTNDGGLARVLELPATGWLRRYRVRAHGDVTQADLDKLRDGVAVDGVLYGPVEATLDRVQGANAWMLVGLREGKNREVKQVLSTLGLEVSRLIRISFGPFQLADLEPGEVREIRGRILRDQLGDRLAEEAGCEFPTGREGEAKPRGKAAARGADAAPRTLKGRPFAADPATAPRPGARERAAGAPRPAGRGTGDRPLQGGGERSRGMLSRDEGRSRGTRSHEAGGSRPPRPAGSGPANHRPRVLAPQDWTGEYASEGPAPKKEDRPAKRGDGPRGAGARGAGPRSAGSRGDAPGGDERPKPVARPPRGHSVWRADDAGGRPLRQPRDPADAARPPRDAGDRAPRGDVSDRPARPPRVDGDRPMRRRPEAAAGGWTPPTGPVTATDKPSRRVAARARDAAKIGDDAPARPAARPSSSERTPYAGRSRGDDRPAPRPRSDFSDRPARPTTRAPRDGAGGDRADRPMRRPSDGPARPPRRTTLEGAERPNRAPRTEGERTYKPRAPRADGDRPYTARPPRAGGDKPYQARGPRAEGERTYKPRTPRADGDRPYTPRAPRPDGDRPYKPRAPRAAGEREFQARPPRAEGERSYKPRAPRAEGAERPPRRFDGDGGRPAGSRSAGGSRPPRSGGPGGAAIGAGRPRPIGDRPRGKPPAGGDRPRPSGPPKGRTSGGPRSGGPKGGGPKGGGPKGRPAGGAPRGRPRDGQ